MSAWDVVSLVVATLALFGAGAGVATFARLTSLAEFLVATYLIGWAWLVAIAFGLSAVDLVTPAGFLLATVGACATGGAAWWLLGRPPVPRLPSRSSARRVLRDPILVSLAVIAVLALAYSLVLGIAVAPNEWDALTYHLSRAALWKQQHSIGLFQNASDSRLNINPPIGEIGQLFVLTLGRGDRFVNALQLVSLLAMSATVYATARRIGLDARAGLFGALAFALLPLPLLQSSSALTDLVVASFLVAATCFCLSTRRAELALGGLALGLAIGTKFTGPLAVPVIGVIALVGPARRNLRWLGLAGAGGIIAGSFWYVLNLVETGRLDGHVGQSGPQTINWIGWRARQYLAGELQFPGGSDGGATACLIAGCVLVALSIALTTRRNGWWKWLLVGGLVTMALPEGARAAVWALERHGADVSPYAHNADTSISWYGPVALLLIPVAFVLSRRAVRTNRMAPVASLLAAAPIVAAIPLLSLSYDPWRGRFFAYSLALSAASWGVALSRRSVAIAVVGLTGTVVALSLGRYLAKPSGLGIVDSRTSIFRESRVDQQLILRSTDGGANAIRFVSEHVPDDAHIALALNNDDYLVPYFGSRYRRHVSFVNRVTRSIPRNVSWIVAASSLPVATCSWSDTALPSGWHVYQRHAETCPDSSGQ